MVLVLICILTFCLIDTVSPKKRSHFYFSNNSVNNKPILMIFGVLNPEKIWHQQLVHLLTSPVYCSHFTLGNPKKSVFNSIIHSYLRLVTLSQKNKLLLHYPLHLKNVAPLLCKNCTNSSSFLFVHVYRVPIRYTDELWNGSVLLRHRLNFSRTWWMIQLISGKKDWKHVSVQKLSLIHISEPTRPY